MSGFLPIKDNPELIAFFEESPSVDLPPGRSPSSSIVGKLAASAGLGALLTFMPAETVRDLPVPAASAVDSGTAAVVDGSSHTALLRPSIKGAEEIAPAPERVVAPIMTAYATVHGSKLATESEERIDFSGVKVPLSVVQAILGASRKTGADPVLMMAMADKESSFDVNAEANTTTAVGLYQFLDQSWLEAIKQHGEKHGLSEEAAAIKVLPNGRLHVEDTDVRGRILDKRRDPMTAALMACERTLVAISQVKERVGADLSRSEGYMTHLLGTNGAGRLLETVATTPYKSSVSVFPKAAAANRALFYASRAKPLTSLELHGRISKQVDSRIKRYETVEERLDVGSPAPFTR